MEALPAGSLIEPGTIRAPDAQPGAPIVLGASMGETPHGDRYQAKQDGVPILLTVLDPQLAAKSAALDRLQRDLARAKKVSHRSLLPIYGISKAGPHHVIAEANPGGITAREFCHDRIARGKQLEAETAYTLIAHVCNALAALHEVMIHGFVTADTVLVSKTGRVFLSGAGTGAVLTDCPKFSKFRSAGLLPNIAPEQLQSPAQLCPGTDVLGIAALFVEMITQLPLRESGQPLDEFGLAGPAELLLCLERATAPSIGARPPDTHTFKSELAEAVRTGPVVRGPVAAGDLPTAFGPPPSAGPPPPPPAAKRDPAKPPPPPKPRSSSPPPLPPQPTGHAPPGTYPHPQPGAPQPGAQQMTPPGYPPYPYPYPPQWGAYPPAPGYPNAPPPGFAPPGYPVYPAYPYPPPGYPQQAPPGAPPSATPPPPGWPGAPGGGAPVPQQRAPAPAAQAHLKALEEAARRIADADDEGAVSAYTQFCDGADDEDEAPHVDEAPVSTSAAPQDARPPEASDEEGRAYASDSSVHDPPALSLDLGSSNAMNRLETLDGQSGGEEPGGLAVQASATRDAGLVESPRPTHVPDMAGISMHGAAGLGDADQRPLYLVQRGGIDEGPFSLFALSAMVEHGELDAGDRIRHRTTMDQLRVMDLPALRQALEKRDQRQALQAFAAPGRRAQPVVTTPQRSPGSWGTIMWVVAALSAFATVGWFLWQRSA